MGLTEYPNSAAYNLRAIVSHLKPCLFIRLWPFDLAVAWALRNSKRLRIFPAADAAPRAIKILKFLECSTHVTPADAVQSPQAPSNRSRVDGLKRQLPRH